MSSPDGCGGPHERAFRQLQKALAACRKHKAKLVIAKLDRLSRNLAFIATLMDSNVEFISRRQPARQQAHRPHPRRRRRARAGAISERTKAALAAAKRRGAKLGGPRLAAARKASIALLSPETPKPIRGQLGVTHRGLDVLVAEPSL